jgi:hypothetical protein
MFEWFDEKRRRNTEKHGVDFAEIERMDLGAALWESDAREDYAEPRYRVLGLIQSRLHVATLTRRSGNLRLISLRKANRREIAIWERRTGRR